MKISYGLINLKHSDLLDYAMLLTIPFRVRNKFMHSDLLALLRLETIFETIFGLNFF
jgi:hypothetical protein